MRRRDFLALLGDAATLGIYQRSATAQQRDRLRRVGVIVSTADDAEGKARIGAFQLSLEKSGWKPGRDVQIDYRFGINDLEKARAATSELLGLAPDVILSGGSPPLLALQQATKTVPIVFAVI